MFTTRMFKISSYEIASWNHKPTQYSVLLKYYVVTQTYFPGLFVQITEQRLVTMLVSLHAQTVLCHLTIQVLNIRVCFIDI